LHILFITSAHNSLSQRLQIELSDLGHRVSIAVVASSDAMLPVVARQAPDLIVAPMLKVAIPEAIWAQHTCLIVHPGIEGDRGPSSLDWAIHNKEQEWGVTVLQAAAEMDAGAIWASHQFPMPRTSVTKSSLYRHEVTEAAVRAVLAAVARFASGVFQPSPPDYGRPHVRGRLRPQMRQADRAIDWKRDSTESIARKIRAADSQPGILDTLFGKPYYLYGAHEEDIIKGAPGEVLAQRDGAICLGTVDAAIWITHLKAKNGPRAGIKLPATLALGADLNVPSAPLALGTQQASRSLREIRYVERDRVGYLYFDFYNGAMSVDQCRRLREAFLAAQAQPTRVIVLFGGRDFWSNGIHLNVIEAAPDPAKESWRNINAINDLIGEILDTTSHLVIAGLRGNAGAGGAMLALAADHVYARRGVVINPHYKGMGGLYGSEYWTCTLPRRVGSAKAIELTERCQPIGTRAATEMGFLDGAFGDDVPEFEHQVMHKATMLANDSRIERLLRAKHHAWLASQRRRPFVTYRAEELKRMWANFFGPDPAYHEARQRFVFKGTQAKQVSSIAPVLVAQERTDRSEANGERSEAYYMSEPSAPM
jgi:putative two-component system hydrogenase maturation factor HypX/HoxX